MKKAVQCSGLWSILQNMAEKTNANIENMNEMAVTFERMDASPDNGGVLNPLLYSDFGVFSMV